MDTKAFRLAQEFVYAQYKRSKYENPEFRKFVNGRRFRNPDTGNDNQFDSLPSHEQVRIFNEWEKNQQRLESSEQGDSRQTQAQIEDLARHGTVVNELPLHSRGVGTGANESRIVELEHQGNKANFIYKPAKGEYPLLRYNIPQGEYHAREEAVYSLDRQMGGRGIVPVTQTRGKDDGSYQQWVEGSRQLTGPSMDALVNKVSIDDLSRNPDFQRLNVLDLISGHQDRHRGNILFSFDGEETPENLRLMAIDNGLSLAGPSKSAEDYIYVHPFNRWYGSDVAIASDIEGHILRKKAYEKGDAAVEESLSNLSPDLHAGIKSIDLSETAQAFRSAGISNPGAIRAVLVRIAALQHDPEIFKKVLEQEKAKYDYPVGAHDGWKGFQHLSGQEDSLLKIAGAGEMWAEIQAIVDGLDTASQGDGPVPDKTDILSQADAWGQTPSPKQGTTSLGERWLRSFVRIANPQGRKLVVSILDMGTLKHEVLGEFELDSSNKVKESYRDGRFKHEIREGVPLMGLRIRPKDGPRFMYALEKAYGSRSMFDVQRS